MNGSAVRRFFGAFCALGVLGFGTLAAPVTAGEEGFETIFDGKTLEGWEGNPKFWSVKDGAITGQTTKDNPTAGNTFIIWRGGELEDFELKAEYRIIGHNSGIQYRSFEVPDKKWVVGGYQADMEAGDRYSGILYGERFRGILADRGQKTVLTRVDGKFKKQVVGSVGDSQEIQSKIKKEDWNEYHIIARGFHFVHKINGVTTCECTDADVKERRASGILALQLHAGPPMTVQFRKIRLKRLKPQKGAFKLNINVPGVSVKVDGKEVKVGVRGKVGVNVKKDGTKVDVSTPKGDVKVRREGANVNVTAEKKKVVCIAGRRSHGYGAHEHKAGCMLLADALNDSGLPVEATVVTGGWPEDASVLDDADSIVIYCDGGGRHPFNKHIEELDRLMDRGIGLVCIHYAVEVPKGKSGEAFLDWTGGYFETNWSVNPHWTAEFASLPKHPIANGVKPFSINDEWYYHMRFREDLEGVTPILSDLPPEQTLKRPDGAHSNNPYVRAAVLERKERQHTAWARQRKDGGRGFGFTGGHNHWNWGNNQFRKLVLNAIVWTAGLEVPSAGVPSKPLTVDELMKNQDYDPPGNFNPARIQAMLDQWNGS